MAKGQHQLRYADLATLRHAHWPDLVFVVQSHFNEYDEYSWIHLVGLFGYDKILPLLRGNDLHGSDCIACNGLWNLLGPQNAEHNFFHYRSHTTNRKVCCYRDWNVFA